MKRSLKIKGLFFCLVFAPITLVLGARALLIQEVAGFTVRYHPTAFMAPQAYPAFRAALRQSLETTAQVLPQGALDTLRQVEIVIVPITMFSTANYSLEHGDRREVAGVVRISYDVKGYETATLVHELAHAYHYNVFGWNEPRITAAYRAAQASAYYRYIDEYGGHRTAYALTNAKEYFAEASTAFFVGNFHPPRSRAELKVHDPAAFKLVKDLWGA